MSAVAARAAALLLAACAPAADPRTEERETLVDQHLRGIRDERVLEAMRRVPRHAFMPEDEQARAYDDEARPIGHGQTISQPTVVAMMTEALRLSPGDKVLEVGTGSGYQAAVLAEITPHVFSIEIVRPLAERARAALDAEGYDTVRTRIGDGYAGWPEEAPFDGIVVTAAPDHVPPALLKQLAVGGRLVIPVGAEGDVQELQVVTRTDEESWESASLAPVRFVPMTGEARER